MKQSFAALLLLLVLSLAACNGGTPQPVTPSPGGDASATPPPTQTAPPTATTVPASPTTAASATPLPSATPPPSTATPTVVATATTAPPTATTVVTVTTQGERPDEAIVITEPGPGSRVISPIRVVGEADPTFEQTLVVRLVNADGNEMALTSTTIQSPDYGRGPYEVEVPFSVTAEEPAWIQVFSEDARDGGLVHLASAGVTLLPSGTPSIVQSTPEPERIAIYAPEMAQVVSGGTLHLEGFGWASFEQTLVADLVDIDGNTLARQNITINSSEMGQPGPFSVELPYTVKTRTPAKVIVRDPSAAFGGTLHLSSVNVTLDP